MRRETIEGLRRDAERRLGDQSHYGDAEIMLRLLNEREALLAFAKRMALTLDRYPYQADLAECAAAIAKAEAP